MLKRLTICLAIFSAGGLACAEGDGEFAEFLEQQQQAFASFEQGHHEEFEAFVKRWQEAEQAYRAQVAKHWQDAELSGRTRLVQYSGNLNQRTIVDYEENTVTVELAQDQSDAEVRETLARELNKLRRTTVAEAASQDPVLVNAGVSVRYKSGSQVGQRKLVPGLADAEFTADAVTISRNQGRVTAKVKVPDRNTLKLAEEFLPLAQENARKWGIPPALILAVAHTESSFNPLARSHIPAFGLMQIVPTSAGKDISQELYGSPRLLTPDYLYDPEKNIEAGSVYLYLLLNRYFRQVADTESRFYMAVSAYNTGPGNVARAMSNTTKLPAATRVANQLKPEEVYRHLLQNLPAQETRNYLTKVTERYAFYQSHLESQL